MRSNILKISIIAENQENIITFPPKQFFLLYNKNETLSIPFLSFIPFWHIYGIKAYTK